MGRKKKDHAIGNSIIKDRFHGRRNVGSADSFLHTSELQDGYDWGRLNLQSVTEQSNLDDFLATAELAGTEFTAERMNIQIVDSQRHTGLPDPEQVRKTQAAEDENRKFLQIPRRPFWDETTTAEELNQKERTAFLDWRRQLARLQENEHLTLTPFERNLDFWRQLWRVLERSDMVVQIVDARNPLLFRCVDLEKYVKEVGADKVNVLLVNKADLLTDQQRSYWAKYFDSVGVTVVFWSAVLETERCAKEQEEAEEKESNEDEEETESEDDEDDDSDSEKEEVSESIDETATGQDQTTDTSHCTENAKDVGNEKESKPTSSGHPTDITSRSLSDRTVETVTERLDSVSTQDAQSGASAREPCQNFGTAGVSEEAAGPLRNNPELLTGEELINFLKALHQGPTYTEGVTTIGLVGYPNVGKSSTINAILQSKKVPVSATPGRTKHFQTLYVERTVLLCDCPGLVMPTFVSTKAEMVISGILPIDQMRDHIPPTSLVCQYIPRPVLEATYGILLPAPSEGEDEDRPPTAEELLASYGYMRGFMTHKGIPDFPRAARHILKDYMNGKLLYAHPPPGVYTEDFRCAAPAQKMVKVNLSDHTARAKKTSETQGMSAVDKQFFSKTELKMGVKGVRRPMVQSGVTGHVTAPGHGVMVAGKKHFKRGKKEKLRRLHGHADS